MESRAEDYLAGIYFGTRRSVVLFGPLPQGGQIHWPSHSFQYLIRAICLLVHKGVDDFANGGCL